MDEVQLDAPRTFGSLQDSDQAKRWQAWCWQPSSSSRTAFNAGWIGGELEVSHWAQQSSLAMSAWCLVAGLWLRALAASSAITTSSFWFAQYALRLSSWKAEEATDRLSLGSTITLGNHWVCLVWTCCQFVQSVQGAWFSSPCQDRCIADTSDCTRWGPARDAWVGSEDDLGRISSKSWRQFGITFTVMAALQTSDQVAFGNWIDNAPRGQSAMPLRYTGNKYDHSNFIKHTLHAFVATLLENGVAGTWDQLNTADIRTWAKEASEKAATWLETPKETLQEFRIPEVAASLFANPLRLKFIRKCKAKVENAPAAPPPPEVEEAPPILPVLDDQYFDQLATQRWRQPGHSGAAEPPTVIYRHIAGLEAPCIILGGLPTAADVQFLRDMKVELIVTCFQERPDKKGAVLPPGAYVFNFCIAGKRRQGSWEALRKLILPALENGESIYVHCMAGVHRAPVAAALILAAVRQLSFDRMVQHIHRLRAIEPHKMLRGELAEWVYIANVGQLPPPQVKVPVPFVTSLMDGALMHAVPHDWNPDAPAPACRWRQSRAGSRGFYSGNIEYVDDVFAAIAYGRPFCQGCRNLLPPGVQQVLWDNPATWRRWLSTWCRIVIMHAGIVAKSLSPPNSSKSRWCGEKGLPVQRIVQSH